MLIILLTLIGYYTVCDLHSPILDIVGKVSSHRNNETINIVYDRKFIIDSKFVGIIQREAVHVESGYRYEFPGFYREFKAGNYDNRISLLLPASAPSGHYELKTYVIWKPLLSVVDHFAQMPDIGFQVCDTKTICTIKEI